MKKVTLANTKENNVKVQALKKISGTKWVGNTIHETLNACLVGINIESRNSGWYNPTGIKINGLAGLYMINQDGSLFFEARVIKEGEKKFRIEYLTSEAWNEFANIYCKLIDENKNKQGAESLFLS